MNRRQFISKSATITALGFIGMPAAAATARLKYCLLGAAHSHAAGKLKVLQGNPRFELVGIYEPDATIRKSLGVPSKLFMSKAEAVKRCDVVVVESGVRDIGKLALEAVKQKKHVHVEKPPTLKLGELQEMIDLAVRNDTKLQVGYMWRHHPGFEKIFEMVRKEWLGEVFMVRAHMSNQLAEERRAEWAEFKGGSFFEQGAHLVDQVVRLLGKPQNIEAALRTHGSTTDALKDNNVVTFEYNKSLAVITNSSLQPNANSYRSFQVLGTKGTATLAPIEPGTLQIDLIDAAGPYKQGIQTVPLPKYERYAGDFEALADSIEGKKPLAISPLDELEVHETLLKSCAAL